MDVASSGQGSRFVASKIDHPRLTKTDAASIRTFLQTYEAYAREVIERARQLTGDDVVSSEASAPVRLQFCVDQEWLQSIIDLGFLSGVSCYEDLTDILLREYLSQKAEQSKEVVTRETLDKLVENELRTDMAHKDARSIIESLFICYQSLLRRNGLQWLIKENERVAIMHVLSAIRPMSLRSRVRSDLSLSHHRLETDFKGFMSHVIKLSESFQLVDNAPFAREKSNSGIRSKNQKKDKSRAGNVSNATKSEDESATAKKAPICLWPAHQAKGYRHFLKNCTACPDDEKKALLKAIAEKKAATGPSRSTRSQFKANVASESEDKKEKVAGRVNDKFAALSSFKIQFQDGKETLWTNGRADDGSDESIVSAHVAERAVLNGIGKMTKISPISLQASLKSGSDAESFTFSRTWTPPRVVLKLSAGPLALRNVRFLVADAEHSVEDILLGLPVLRHLGIDTETLLEERRDLLDGADCSSVQYGSDKGGRVSRLMIARLNRVTNIPAATDGVEDLHRGETVDYYQVREEKDPFPDASTLDPLDVDQTDEVRRGIQKMLKEAEENGLPKDNLAVLDRHIHIHINVFRTSFSVGPPAKVDPLKISILSNASLVRVRLRNYSKE